MKVAAGRQREMASIYRHDVKEDVLNSEAVGGVHVKGDWVEDNKGDVVRSRFVVKQIAYDYRDDVSQSSPALLVFRMMLAFAQNGFELLHSHPGHQRCAHACDDRRVDLRAPTEGSGGARFQLEAQTRHEWDAGSIAAVGR